MTRPSTILLADVGGSSAVVAFVIYMVGVFVLAWMANRVLQSKRFMSEYFLGSRSLGVWAFALTFAATSASGGSFMGFPSVVYTHGWIVGLWIGGYMVVPIVSMGLLGKRINHVARKANAITIPDLLRERFDSPAFATLATILLVFFVSCNLIAQFKGGSIILQTLLEDVEIYETASSAMGSAVRGMPYLGMVKEPGYLVCLLVFAIAVVIYTTYGGFRAVVWTDVMQGIVMVLGVVIMLPLTLAMVGGLEQASEKIKQMTPPQRVLLLIRPDRLPAEGFAVPRHSWIVSHSQESKRVFRLTNDAKLSAEGTWVQVREPGECEGDFALVVPALEITTPYQVAELKATEFPVSLQPIVVPTRQIELQTDVDLLPGTAVAVPAMGASDADADPPRDEIFILAQTVAASGENQTVEGIRIHDIVASEPTASLAGQAISPPQYEKQYRYGAGQTNVYAQGPGPSPNSADAFVGFLPLSLAMSYFFMWTFSGAGQPGNMVRLMAFKDAKTLRRAMLTVAVYYSLIYFPLVIIFVCARVILPGWEDAPDRIMPEMSKAVTTWIEMPWLAGLLVAAPFAAVMSTMDSFLLLISSSLVRDVYQRNINPDASEKTMKWISYTVTVVIGTAAMIAAANPPKFLQDIIIFTGSGLSTSFLIPVGLSLYWPRMNKTGAIAGMLGGFSVYMLLYVVGYLLKGTVEPIKPFYFHPFIVGALSSLVISVVATLLTAPPPDHIVRKYFVRADKELS